jgi:hypothetical protein
MPERAEEIVGVMVVDERENEIDDGEGEADRGQKAIDAGKNIASTSPTSSTVSNFQA